MLSKIQDFLIPNFLKRLDFWLMTHKPHVWRTRGHFVLFYCLIAALIMYICGKFYPQNFADFYDSDYIRNNSLVGYLIFFLCFTSVGITLWWWHSIQKFGYKRTNVLHFLIEVGIYTLGLFSISLFVFGFSKGFHYRQAFQLEKNSREDSIWVVKNDFFQYGYMPHFYPNKEVNFKEYFKQGEALSQKMKFREGIVYNILKAEDTTSNDIILNEEFTRDYDYKRRVETPSDAFSYSHWEYPKNEKIYSRPPQYKQPADYVNKILSNDTFWKQEEKRLKFKEYDNASREILTDMTYDEISNLVDEVYPKYFHRINYFNQTQTTSRSLLEIWILKRQFLESLSNQEIKLYKEYLTWLKGNFALYAPQPILNFEKNAARGFYLKRNSTGYTVKGKEDYFEILNGECYEYFDDDKGELAGEKLLKLLEKLDVESFKKYLKYLNDSNYYEKLLENKKNPFYPSLCKNYYKNYTPKTQIDSLYHYDYYQDNAINELTWLNIIQQEYAHYVADKYSENDYNRLRNMLHINSFEDVYVESKNTTIQRLLQLHQVDDYTSAIRAMNASRYEYKNQTLMTFSYFALIYCVLFAIVFYIMTLSNGLQFGVSAFISGFFVAFLLFIQRVNPSNYFSEGHTAYPPLITDSYQSYPVGELWNKQIMILFCILLMIMAIVMLFRKTQLSKAHIIFNIIMFSTLFGLVSVLEYWANMVEIRIRYEQLKGYYSMPMEERVRIYSLVLICAIGIYLFMAWLFKRHLTYPKKK
jgi:hypothetical protein